MKIVSFARTSFSDNRLKPFAANDTTTTSPISTTTTFSSTTSKEHWSDLVLLIGGNGYARGTGVEGSIILFILLAPYASCFSTFVTAMVITRDSAGVSDDKGSIILLLFHLNCLPQYKLGSMKASHCSSLLCHSLALDIPQSNSTFIKLKYHFRCGALLAAMFYPVSPSRGTALRRLRRGSRSLMTIQYKYFLKGFFFDERVPTYQIIHQACATLIIQG